MWHKIKIKNVSGIEKCVAEFVVWMWGVLPYGKMKIKIHENQNGSFFGITDIGIKRKFDKMPEYIGGMGKSIEEALEKTINNFNEIIESDYPIDKYPHGLSENDIEYAEYSDF